MSDQRSQDTAVAAATGPARQVSIGYYLLSEQHPPSELVGLARRAEEVGFDFALISDHFHPWIDRQGQSPFVWSVLGGIAEATSTLRVGTAVTCPLFRMHPAIVAHAAATAAMMMPERFLLGLGTGENLNEHVLGQRWPSALTRLEMLEEAVEIIRLLLQGGMRSYRGRYYTVESARLYSVPDEPPPILIAAGAKRSLALAGRIGDGLIGDTFDSELLGRYDQAGGSGKPRFGGPGVCWAKTEDEARRVAHEWWPTSGLSGELHRELPLPRHFEQAAAIVRETDVSHVCGPDPERHLAAIKTYIDAGYDHVFVSQAGPDQDGFFDFYEREVLPLVPSLCAARQLD